MPFRTLKLKPGVNKEQSPTLNQFQLATSNLIRYYGGLVQKLGGWAQITMQTLVGVCRGLHGWADIVGNPYLAAGTDQRLEVLIGGTLNDITPIVATTNPAISFSTVIGSTAVTILDAGDSPSAGDWINLLTPLALGGITMQGFYHIQSIVDGTHYVVTIPNPAVFTQTSSGAIANFSTTSGSATVTVQWFGHNLNPGDLFNPGVATTAGGLTISGTYSVASVISSSLFTITAASTAGSNASNIPINSGNARIQYLLPSGVSSDTSLTGYGAGDYGAGDFGGSSGGATIAVARQWSLDHFGQDLIASPTNGAIYFWQPPTVAPATVVSGSAPIYNAAVFVMPQAEIIIALGAEIGGTQEPLLVRWCSVADFTDWTATAINQAGSYSIPTGSRLVGGLASGLGATIWTDQDVWSVTYLGFPLVFGFNNISPGSGMLSLRMSGSAGGLVMWLGRTQFYQYSIGGGVKPIECDVWDFYFYNADQTQLGQFHCAVNALFNEMAWHFPIATSSPLYNPLAPIAYVKFNYVENCWDFGLSSQYQRTAWAPASPMGNPIGADNAGLLQQHEVGFDANGVAMQWSWRTGYFSIGDGEDFAFSDFLIPDFVTVGNPTFTPTLQTVEYPNDTPTDVVTMQFSNMTKFITYSARGRQMSLGFSGGASDVGTFSRLGAIRVRYAPDGRA